jgi:hypothetical protein
MSQVIYKLKYNKMEKWIIWFVPDNTKIQLRQFHTEAETMNDALKNLEKNADFTFKVLGVSDFYNLGDGSKSEKDNRFKDNSFHA